MKRTLSMLCAAVILLAAAGCTTERNQAAPSPEPTEVPESAAPKPTLYIQNPADVLKGELTELFCGEYDTTADVVDVSGGFHVSLTLKSDDYIPDEVYADYVAGFAPYIVLRSIELKMPITMVSVSASSGLYGDEDYQSIVWRSTDGISGSLDYAGKSEDMRGKRLTKDVTPFDVQDILGTAGIEFYE